MNERDDTLRALWARVNEIAMTTEDTAEIRGLIAEAGIAPRVHEGVAPEDFTTRMKAEWALGQWADCIDEAFPFMNTVRNVSLAHFDPAEVAS